MSNLCHICQSHNLLSMDTKTNILRLAERITQNSRVASRQHGKQDSAFQTWQKTPCSSSKLSRLFSAPPSPQRKIGHHVRWREEEAKPVNHTSSIYSNREKDCGWVCTHTKAIPFLTLHSTLRHTCILCLLINSKFLHRKILFENQWPS